MLPKPKRFSRGSFPKGRPMVRRSFPWGAVSLYEGEPKVAVVVSKKTLKKAHDRNRAKRRVYAALQGSERRHGIIVSLRSESLMMPLSHIKKDIEGILTRSSH